MAMFENWFRNLPLVTKTWMTGCFITSAAVHFDLLTPFALYLNFDLIWYKYEVWRLITNFLYFDKFSINFVFHMYFLVMHSSQLEDGSFRGNTAGYFYMLFLGALSLIGIDFLLYYYYPFFLRLFLASSLNLMIVYVWGRRNPNNIINILGIYSVRAPYLPWVLVGFGLLLGGFHAIFDDILGIIVGHVYFYLEDIYPQYRPGRRILKTPNFLKQWFGEDNNIPNIIAEEDIAQPQQ
eukprot:TRINITY_DN202_c1_g1_i1.p1 TRINITY_DN202_c1_g1~~TRINITY_DN202_c1_g1_i1.p1  ORF type:complete len:237 (-),score=45.10 TRINITY_DN202_c1_g1_i1:216-926(-)